MTKGKCWWGRAAVLLLALLVLVGCTRKKTALARIQRVEYVDLNFNAVTDDGDLIRITFNRNVVVNSSSTASFTLPVAGDTFGSAATVGQFNPGTRYVEIDLAGGPVITPNFSFDPANVVPGNPSGLNISDTMAADAIETAGNKVDARPSPQAADIEGTLGTPVKIIQTEFQDLGNAGVVDGGDRITVTFDGLVDTIAVDPATVLRLPVSGDSFGVGAFFIGPTSTTPILEFELFGGTPVLTPNGTYDGVSLSPGDPSGVDLMPGLPLGTIVHSVTGVNASVSPPGVDLGGQLLVPPAPRIISVDFDDADGSRQANDGDRLLIVFDRTVTVASASVAGFGLPVTGDTLGLTATLGQSTPGSTQVEVTLSGGPVLTVNGIFSSGQTMAGSPSGLSVLPVNDIRDFLTGATAAQGGPLDVVGILEPFVVSSIFIDRDNSGFVSLDDYVQVTFDRNVSAMPGTLPASAFQLPHPGDSLGINASLVGQTLDTPTLTVRLGIYPSIAILATFDPFNPAAGPSGIDVLPGTNLVRDVDGAVGAEPRSPVGVDIFGIVGPKIARIHFQDTNYSQTVDPNDRVVFVFGSVVDINDNDPVNIFEPQVAGDTFGAGAQFLGGAGPQGVQTATVVLGTGPVLTPNGYFNGSMTSPGDPSGFDLLPGAPVVLGGTALPALRRTPVGTDLRGSLPGLLGAGPWVQAGGGLTTARFGHTTTVLQDGKILIVGGGNLAGSLNSIEIFDPSGGVPGVGQFSVAPVTLNTAREAHTATRVGGPDRRLDTPDDVVVVIGGIQQPGPTGLGSIEIIDPDANDDGVTGDYQVFQVPAANDFSRYVFGTPPVQASVFWHDAVFVPRANTRIPGGPGIQDNLGRQIFVVGGGAWDPNITSVVFIIEYELSIVTVDPNGDGNYSDTYVTIYEVPTGGYRMGKLTRWRPTVTLLPGVDGVVGTDDDEIFVYGGAGMDRDDPDPGGPRARVVGSGEIIYGIGTNQTPDYAVVAANNFYPNAPQQTGSNVGVDPTPRDVHRAVLLGDGSVLIGQGTNEDLWVPFTPSNNLTAAYERFVPNYGNRAASTFSFNAVAPIPPAGSVEEALTGPGAVPLPNLGRVLVAGGTDTLNSGLPTALAEDILALASPSPFSIFTANSMSSPRANHLAAEVPIAFPLVLAPGVDLMIGSADDRAIAIGGVDDLDSVLSTADFFIP